MTHLHKLKSLANQVLDTCESTNDLAKQLAAAGLPHGTWVSARSQESGRGRLGRKWESPRGNLFLSIVTRVTPKELWTWLPLTTAVGATRCLRSLLPNLKFQIKWPNDLWLGGAKMGGILCESSLGSSTTHENPAIIVGIGINCLSSPSGLPQAATHLTLGLEEKQMTADAIRKPILDSVLNEIKILQNAGPQSVCEFYEESAVLSPGTWIQWGNPERFGKVTRLGSVGELIVHLDSQESQDSGEVHLYAEDVKITAWGKKKEAPKI